MPLTQRQAELADAALAIVARDGSAAVSFRTIAAESGWSLGAVQRAFASKGEIEAAMLERLRAGVGTPPGEPGRPTLQTWLVELVVSTLPLDERRRALTLQGAAFAERAAHDSSIGATIAAGDDEIRGLLASLVSRATAEGELGRDVDPDATAHLVLALAQGLAAQLLYQPRDDHEVRLLVDTAVGRLLGHPS